MRKPTPAQLKEWTLTLEKIFEVLDEAWLYDLLPGNGQDDYILGELRKAFILRARPQ